MICGFYRVPNDQVLQNLSDIVWKLYKYCVQMIAAQSLGEILIETLLNGATSDWNVIQFQ